MAHFDPASVIRKQTRWSTLYWPLLAILTWLAAMAWIWARIGPLGIGWGLALSTMVMLPVAGAFLWLARCTKASPGLLLSAFAWGASVAGFCSIWSQEWLQTLVDSYLGIEFGHWFRPLVITPVTEELFKGVFLLWMFAYRQPQIRGLLEGIIYGGLIGAGFAFSEQIMYFGQIVITYLASDRSDQADAILAMSFVLRGVMVPFMHSFFVAFIGMGVAAAAAVRNRAAQTLLLVSGFLFPIILHGVWDWGGLASDDPFMIYKIYSTVMLPLFVTLTILTLILRRRRSQSSVIWQR